MSALEPMAFGLQYGKGRSSFVSAELADNCYVSANADSDRSRVHLIRTPGLKRAFTVGDGPCRGMHALNDELYVVSGTGVYRVIKFGGDTYSSQLIGTIPDNGPVDMTANAYHVAIVTPSRSYAANKDGVLEIPEANLFGASYQDGYGIFSRIGTEDWYVSKIDDLTDIGALDFSNADSFPDKLVGHVSDHGEVGLFGARSIEWWQNTGNQAFPFERAQRIEWGCGAGRSIAKSDSQVFFLDHNYRVCRSVGYQIDVVSDDPVHYAISQQGDARKTARGYLYAQDNHLHYVLRFDRLTLCYDVASQRWHQRSSLGHGRWRAEAYAHQWDKNLVGDYVDGRIYELDLDTYTEDGDPIRRRVHSHGPYNQGGRMVTDELFVDVEGGVGLDGGSSIQGNYPLLSLSWTDDGGATWSGEKRRSVGRKGEYKNRARWHRLGASRDRIYRLEMSDPVKFQLLGMYARIERLAA